MLKALDALTKIIERSIKALRTLEAYGDRRKKRKLAQTLHLTYVRLNDCISIGEQIVDVLESFAKDPSQYSYTGRHRIGGDGIYLDALTARQSENLDALADCLRDYSEIIRALDSKLYVDLQQFVAFKGVGVDWIGILLKHGKIPFDCLGLEDLEQLATRSRFMLGEEPPQQGAQDKDALLEGRWAFLPWYDQIAEISSRMDDNSIERVNLFEDDQKLDSPTNAENLRRLNDLLRRDDPRQHLADAKDNLRKIKQFLETNFSVVELMIDVGSEQLKKKIDW